MRHPNGIRGEICIFYNIPVSQLLKDFICKFIYKVSTPINWKNHKESLVAIRKQKILTHF